MFRLHLSISMGQTARFQSDIHKYIPTTGTNNVARTFDGHLPGEIGAHHRVFPGDRMREGRPLSAMTETETRTTDTSIFTLL